MRALPVVLSFAFVLLIRPLALGAENHGAPAGPIVATVSLPYDTVLPGVPFDIEVTLKNVSRRSAKVGVIAYLVVALPDGGTFRTSGNDAAILEPQAPDADLYIELAPGEVARRAIGWERGTPPNWCRYPDFSAPGTYEVALELQIGAHRDDDDLSNYVGRLRTSSARLERVVPAGDDEALWERMQELTGRHWPDGGFAFLKEGKDLAREIIELHPASSYYPYALLLDSFARSEKDIPVLLSAAERFPKSRLLMNGSSVCRIKTRFSLREITIGFLKRTIPTRGGCSTIR